MTPVDNRKMKLVDWMGEIKFLVKQRPEICLQLTLFVFILFFNTVRFWGMEFQSIQHWNIPLLVEVNSSKFFEENIFGEVVGLKKIIFQMIPHEIWISVFLIIFEYDILNLFEMIELKISLIFENIFEDFSRLIFDNDFSLMLIDIVLMMKYIIIAIYLLYVRFIYCFIYIIDYFYSNISNIFDFGKSLVSSGGDHSVVKTSTLTGFHNIRGRLTDTDTGNLTRTPRVSASTRGEEKLQNNSTRFQIIFLD